MKKLSRKEIIQRIPLSDDEFCNISGIKLYPTQMEEAIDVEALRFSDRLRYGDPDGPTFEFLVQKANSKGLYGDNAYRYILSSSARANEAINAYLNVSK